MISIIAIIITAVAAVIGVTFGIYRYNADSKTKLKIYLDRAGLSTEQAVLGQMASIRVVNHSKFATTIRGIHIRKNDGVTMLVHEECGAKWVVPFSGTPARLESREEIVVALPNGLFENATHVEATTVDGYTESLVIKVRP